MISRLPIFGDDFDLLFWGKNTDRILKLLVRKIELSEHVETALTAQRYRIRRRISQLRFREFALLQPVCEVGRRRIVALRDKLLGGPVGEQRLDFRTVLVQLAFTGAFRPSDRQAGSPSRAKGFFRPRGDQPRSISAAIFPPKSRSKSPRKLGGAKSMIYTPFQ